MTTRNVELTEQLDQFIEVGVASGRFRDASEVIREGLRLLEQRESDTAARRAWLLLAAKEGFDAIAAGDFVTLQSPAEIDTAVREIFDEVMAEPVRG